MNTRNRVIFAVLAALAVLAVVSCAPAGGYSALQVAEASRELRGLVPAIEAGLALSVPENPTARALTPSSLLTTGTNPWTYGTQTPSQVYAAAGGTTGTVRLPASGYYTSTGEDQLYLRLTPESGLGAGYYRVVLYTYPAFDLTVAYSIEEYIVNDAGTESWAWGNLNLSKVRDSWVALTTAYLDGTTGARTLVWSSGPSSTYYAAFPVGEPVPTDTVSFAGYRYEEATSAPPVARAGSEVYSSSVTEQVTGKGNVVDAIQYYTETSLTAHSGLTYVFKDKKRKWSVDTYIVTRMEEDTAAGTKKIRSVGEVGTTQYYIDKVDISRPGGVLTYTSTHDVYSTALPRGADRNAAEFVALELVEDAAGVGTFTGTLQQTDGASKVSRTVKVARDGRHQLILDLGRGATAARGLGDQLTIVLSQQHLSALSIPLTGVRGTFEGYYEAGSLFGTVTAGDQVFDVVIAEEGIAVDDELFGY